MPKSRLTGTGVMEGLVDLGRSLGYLVHHETDSRKTDPGFPDLLFVGWGAIVAMECKSERETLRPPSQTKKGRYLPGQLEWLQAFADVPAFAFVVRPETGPFDVTMVASPGTGAVIECAYEQARAFLVRLRDESLGLGTDGSDGND